MFSEPSELAIVGPDALPLLRLVRSTYRPNMVVASAVAATSTDAASSAPLLTDRPAIDGATTAYLCRRCACESPVTTVDDLAKLLGPHV